MRKALLLFCLLLMPLGSVWAFEDRSQIPTDRPSLGSESAPASFSTRMPKSIPSELDQIGDTLHISYTWYDIQHNTSDGRMIGYVPDSDMVHIVWMRSPDQALASRHEMYGQISNAQTETPQFQLCGNDGVDNGIGRSGYGTIAISQAQNVGIPVFHHDVSSQGDHYHPKLALESTYVANFYDLFVTPEAATTDYQVVQPMATMDPNGYVHVMSSDAPDGLVDPMQKLYMRWLYDPAANTLTPATSDGELVLMTTNAIMYCADLSTTAYGIRLAYAENMPRAYTIGEDEATQWNNDVYIWESLDAGLTWDLENPIDVTQWLPPNEELMPDSTAANQDTLRAYMDNTLIYDFEDKLYVAFTTPSFYFFQEQITYSSRIFHWCREQTDLDGNPYVTQIAEAKEGYMGNTETFGETADRPCLYSDPDTGILWAIFRQASTLLDNPDTTDVANGYACGEIFVTASPPGPFNGLLWVKPVNLTNTKYLETTAAQPGDVESEIDPSLALHSEGDYLHLMYVIDTWPDRVIDSDATRCPVVYHRVAKQELIDIFEENGEWQENYPMHIDSTGFWEDPANYAWNGYGGFFTTDRINVVSIGEQSATNPVEFELKQNYPNPFNPSTQITFSLSQTTRVKLMVYDVLGREVATLLNRTIKAGNHQVSFLADDLPSGVYFYKLTSGNQSRIRKMILMK